MLYDKDTDLLQADSASQPATPSGWSAIPIKKNTEILENDNEKQEAEQKIYSEPDNPPPRQETGGPDKPTA